VKAARHKGQILYDSIFRNFPEQEESIETKDKLTEGMREKYTWSFFLRLQNI
jgi:hypothetical protein